MLILPCLSLAQSPAQLVLRLDDPSPARARQAGDRLALGAAAVPALAGCFERPNRNLVRQAFRALELIGGPARATIEQAIGHTSPFVRQFALQALAHGTPAPALVPRIRGCLADADPLVREQAAATLRRLADDQTLVALRAAASDPEPGVRLEAVRSLAAARGVLDVVAALGDPVRTNRIVAVELLKRLDPRFEQVPRERLLDLAAALREAGQLEPAAVQLSRARTQGPDRPRLHYEQGLLHDARGDHKARETAFRDALRLDPAYRPPHHFAARTLIEQGKLEQALERLAPLLPRAGRETRRLQARCLALIGRPAEAVGALELLLLRWPGDREATIEIARLQFQLGREEPAREALGRWIERQPYRCEAHLLLGLLHKRAGRLDQAEAAFRAGLAQDSRSRALLYNLGVLYDDRLDRPREALDCFRRYLALGGKQPDVPVFVAVLQTRLQPTPERRLAAARGLASRGFAKEALEYTRKVLADRPDEPAAHRLAGELLLAQGQGLAALRHLLRGKPVDVAATARATALLNRPLERKEGARLLLEAGRLAPALALADRCSDALFGAADFQYLRGEILRGLGRTKDAMTHYRLAAQLNVYFAPHLRMAQLEDRPGRRDRALAHYRRYLQLCEAAPEASKRIAELERLPR